MKKKCVAPACRSAAAAAIDCVDGLLPGIVRDLSATTTASAPREVERRVRHADRLNRFETLSRQHERKVAGARQIVRDASQSHESLLDPRVQCSTMPKARPSPSSVRPRGLYSAPIQPSYPSRSRARKIAG